VDVVYLSIGKRTKELDLWFSNITDYWPTRKKGFPLGFWLILSGTGTHVCKFKQFSQYRVCLFVWLFAWWCLASLLFQQYFSYIVELSFIGGGNRRKQEVKWSSDMWYRPWGFKEPSWSWSWLDGSWIYNYLCNHYLSPLVLWVLDQSEMCNNSNSSHSTGYVCLFDCLLDGV
jgi:hypothetical protein